MGKTARNEKRKLMATLFNGAGVAALATVTLNIVSTPLGQVSRGSDLCHRHLPPPDRSAGIGQYGGLSVDCRRPALERSAGCHPVVQLARVPDWTIVAHGLEPWTR
jgi:hypothetical protein